MLQAFADLWRIDHGEKTVINHEGLNRFSVVSGHGPGKTYFAAQLMHYAGFTRKIQIPCVATKEKQVLTRIWPRFRAIRLGAIAEYQPFIEINDRRIFWDGDSNWFATPEASQEDVGMAGYHPNGMDDWVLFVIDEASGIRQKIFEAIAGVLSSPHTAIFMIGNPTANQGEFYESHNKPGVMKLYYRRHVSLEDSSYTDKKYVAELIERYGRESPITKVRGFGEFADMAENQLIAYQWLLNAAENEEIVDTEFYKLRVTVDVADGGEDETIITVAKLKELQDIILKQYRFSFPAAESPILAADHAERIWKEWSGRPDTDDIVVDSIGVGAGTAGTLIQRGLPIITYRGGEHSDDTKLWRNRRVQSHLVMRNGLRDGRTVFGPQLQGATPQEKKDFNDLCAQLCSIKSKPGIERVEDLETKQEMKRRGLKSPDMAEGMAMVYATQSPTMMASETEIILGPQRTTGRLMEDSPWA